MQEVLLNLRFVLAELIGQFVTVKNGLEPALHVIGCGRYFDGPGRLPIVGCCTLLFLSVAELLPFVLDRVEPGEVLDRFFVQLLDLQEQALCRLHVSPGLLPLCRFLGVELDDPLRPYYVAKVRVLQVADFRSAFFLLLF